MASNFVLLRGLTRGNPHWGNFPAQLRAEINASEAPNETADGILASIESGGTAHSDLKYCGAEAATEGTRAEAATEVKRTVVNGTEGTGVELLEILGNGTRHSDRTPIDPVEVIADLRNRSRLLRKGPIHLVGVSLGGMIALKWAELFPTDLVRVVAINSSLSQCSGPWGRLSVQGLLTLGRALLERKTLEREKLILSLCSNNPKSQAEHFVGFAQFAKQHPIHLGNFVRQLLLAQRIKINQAPPLPVELIASRKDRLVPSQCSIALSQEFGWPIRWHDWAGHDLPLDDGEWLAKVLTENGHAREKSTSSV